MCTIFPHVHPLLCILQKGLYGGYATFVVSIAMIGLTTAIIGDVAGHLGCFIFLKDSVNAIAFVALGTSVPGKIILEVTGNYKVSCFQCYFSMCS